MQETKEIIKQVKKIEITTKKLVDGIISGNFHSIFKGQGIEFSEIKDYRPGDDIRTIDWKVTARFDHPYVKEFIEERDLRVYFVFDLSASGSFGNIIEKKRKAIELCASLMFSAMKNNDKVGLFLFTEGVEKYIPARKGKKHILKLLSNLISYKSISKKTNIENTLNQVSKIMKKRSIVFLISDFYDSDSNYIKPLKLLKRKHDVIAIKINDAREKELPNVGLIELEDEETGEQLLIDTSDVDFRKNYEKIIKNHEINLNNNLRKNKIEILNILTDEPYEIALKRFFKNRLLLKN